MIFELGHGWVVACEVCASSAHSCLFQGGHYCFDVKPVSWGHLLYGRVCYFMHQNQGGCLIVFSMFLPIGIEVITIGVYLHGMLILMWIQYIIAID